LNIQQNISLKPYNTFGIDVLAKRFVRVNSIDELLAVLKVEKDIFLLSGGSNMLLTSDIDRLVVYLNLKGIQVQEYENDTVCISCDAGEDWHEFVLWCISHNYGGLENLSLIPGNVGTSPIQNIGAYGVEIKDVFYELKAVEIATGKIKTFSLEDCQFGYRNSIFKNELKGRFVIISVSFILTKNSHNLNTSYGALKSQLVNVKNLNIRKISDTVITIRKSKLPDPKIIGNGGSFFKNPIVSAHFFQGLNKKHPKIPHYLISETQVKIPAAWLIEQCGFKGQRYGDAGVHSKQALVLVNYNNASGDDILNLARRIQTKVKKIFDVSLEIEVNVI
jgi:UDP-N-acetylmuramate dehydrogenase